MEQNPLFFIAILPDAALQQEVTAFKHYCARHFNARHALKSPPHITLVSPFRWPEIQLPKLGDCLENFAAEQEAFSIDLRDFGCFAPRVLFVGIVPNPALEKMANALAIRLEQQVNLKQQSAHGFNPHMTIAHRDLERAVFPRAWTYFSKQEFRRSFRAEALMLLRLRGGKWVLEDSFSFTNHIPPQIK